MSSGARKTKNYEKTVQNFKGEQGNSKKQTILRGLNEGARKFSKIIYDSLLFTVGKID